MTICKVNIQRLCSGDKTPSIDEIRDDQDISLAHLDKIRHLLEAWSIEEGHTRATSGMLIDE